MTNRTNFPLQTHFIGVLLPDDLEQKLEECRRYMNMTYGCHSGHATALHVTLVPPLALPPSCTTDELVFAIENDVLPVQKEFTACVNQFDAFGDRTIFACVENNEHWKNLRDSVYSALNRVVPGHIKKDRRPFTPHITVANRDIPLGAVKDALDTLNEIPLAQEFPVDNITIFERKEKTWKIAASLCLPSCK